MYYEIVWDDEIVPNDDDQIVIVDDDDDDDDDDNDSWCCQFQTNKVGIDSNWRTFLRLFLIYLNLPFLCPV